MTKDAHIKVEAIYDWVMPDNQTLWGVAFALEDGVYTALLPTHEAQAMADAGRVKIKGEGVVPSPTPPKPKGKTK
jgi:hypothetical protein